MAPQHPPTTSPAESPLPSLSRVHREETATTTGDVWNEPRGQLPVGRRSSIDSVITTISSHLTPPPPLPPLPPPPPQPQQPLKQQGRRFLPPLRTLCCPSFGLVVILGSFIIQMFTTSTIPTMGIFQAYYLNVMFPDEPATKISWIGTVNFITLFGLMAVGGLMFERIGPRFTCALGVAFMAVGYILASLCTKIWQLVLTQGLLVGTGGALLNAVAIVIPLDYFEKRQSLAVGISSSGAGIGGIWLPVVIQHIINHHGIHWALRVQGLIIFVVCGLSTLLMVRSRAAVPSEADLNFEPSLAKEKEEKEEAEAEAGHLDNLKGGPKGSNDGSLSIHGQRAEVPDRSALPPPSPQNGESLPMQQQQQQEQQSHQEKQLHHTHSHTTPLPLIDLKILLDLPLWILFFVMFFMSIGINAVSGYVVASTHYYGISTNKAALLPTIMSITHAVGNIVSGYAADKVSALIVLLVSLASSGVFTFALWLPATNYAMFATFSTLMGLVAMNTNNTIPIVTVQLYGLKRIPSITGFILLSSVFGALGGNYSLAAIYDHIDHRGRFWYTIVFTGVTFVITALTGLALAFVFWRRSRMGLLQRV